MHTRIRAPRPLRGLVLLEMLMAGFILVVLATLAIPTFAAMAGRWKVRAAGDALTSSIYAARAEALKRGGGVTLAASALEGCKGAARNRWDCGWAAFVDENDDGRRDPSDPLLFVGQPPRGIDVEANRNLVALKFDAWGRIEGLGAYSFRLRSQGPNASTSMLCISAAGRIRVASGSDAC